VRRVWNIFIKLSIEHIITNWFRPAYNPTSIMRSPLSCIVICLLVAPCCVAQATKTYTPTFIVSEESLFPISQDQAYTFGYLEVPENRSAANEKVIKLPIYIFKSRSKTPKNDPIIYLVGGPGASIMNAVPYMEYYQYLDDRDFILFEQRGTTYAQPHLGCPEWAEARRSAQLPGVSVQQGDSLLRQAASDCRRRLTEEGNDLNGYNTRESAADVADLRKALGIDQYNLLTISYGTKIAQTLMRDDPEGIRSVVMDSPLPIEANWDLESNQNLLETYDLLFSACAVDSACNARFPGLKTRFFAFLEEITLQPLEIRVQNPQTEKEETFLLRGKDLIGLLAEVSTRQIPELPLMISHILADDYRLIQAQLQSLFAPAGKGNGIGMRLSVWCAEEAPFVSKAAIEAESNRYPAIKGASPALYDPEICNIWGVKPLDARENEPVTSSVPTLLISGEYDTATPAKWARQMTENLANSYHLVFRGWQHTPTTYWDNPCGMRAANAFFNDPSQKLAPGCLQGIRPPVFMTEP
jgi:pimeloyl-ACP methyl ester carboxylesterase